MTIPNDLRYTSDHEWARDEGDGTCTIGVTDFAQDSLGPIVYVELPAPGTVVKAGERCGAVESTKSVSDLYSPLTGEVVAANGALDGQPDLVNSEPYAGGWMVRLRMTDPGELAGLPDADAYALHVAAAHEVR